MAGELPGGPEGSGSEGGGEGAGGAEGAGAKGVLEGVGEFVRVRVAAEERIADDGKDRKNVRQKGCVGGGRVRVAFEPGRERVDGAAAAPFALVTDREEKVASRGTKADRRSGTRGVVERQGTPLVNFHPAVVVQVLRDGVAVGFHPPQLLHNHEEVVAGVALEILDEMRRIESEETTGTEGQPVFVEEEIRAAGRWKCFVSGEDRGFEGDDDRVARLRLAHGEFRDDVRAEAGVEAEVDDGDAELVEEDGRNPRGSGGGAAEDDEQVRMFGAEGFGISLRRADGLGEEGALDLPMALGVPGEGGGEDRRENQDGNRSGARTRSK